MTYELELLNRGPSDIVDTLRVRIFVPTFVINEKSKRFEIAKFKNASCEYIDHDCVVSWKEKNEEDNSDEIFDDESDSIFVAGILQNETTSNREIQNTFIIECEKNSVECVELQIDIENVQRSTTEKLLISLNIDIQKSGMSE